MSDERNNWNEYSRLVLKELESLANSIESLRDELHNVKQELAKIREREDKVEQLRAWKARIDDVVSPTQLKETLAQIEELKTFKAKSITIFMVVQFFMGLAMWAFNYLK
jgi:predicted nuclease with TOPRIM domain